MHVYYADQTGLLLGATVDYSYYRSVEDLVKAVNMALVASGNVDDNIKLTYSAHAKSDCSNPLSLVLEE